MNFAMKLDSVMLAQCCVAITTSSVLDSYLWFSLNKI